MPAALAPYLQASETAMDTSTRWETSATGGVRPPMEKMPSAGTSTQVTPLYTAAATTHKTGSLFV